MEAINVQWEKTMLDLESTYLQHEGQLIKINIEMENCTHELRVQIQKLKGELETLCNSLGEAFQPTYMDNWLKEFEKLLLDNTLFKVQN